MTSLAELKQLYPCRETLARIMPDHLRKKGREYDQFLCPFHYDHQPSLQVYDERMTCRTGCLINGGEWGDILDFVKEYYSLRTWREVETQLTGKFPEPPKREMRPEIHLPERRLRMADVIRAEAHQKEAIPFFESRGLKRETIQQYRMGAYLSWPNTVRINGEDHTFRARRWAIPDIAFGVVRNIELRLDEEDALKTYQAINPLLRRQLAEEVKTEDERKLLYNFFGGKYTRVPGGVRRDLIFNVERTIQRISDPAGWFSPDLPYVLLHEGKLKALVMENACDDDYIYPSIAAKGAAGLAALVGVKELIICQDTEADVIRPDGTQHNPGRAYALRALELSGRRLGEGVRIVQFPDGIKDADQLCLEGDVHQWMESLHLPPLRRSATLRSVFSNAS